MYELWRYSDRIWTRMRYTASINHIILKWFLCCLFDVNRRPVWVYCQILLSQSELRIHYPMVSNTFRDQYLLAPGLSHLGSQAHMIIASESIGGGFAVRERPSRYLRWSINNAVKPIKIKWIWNYYHQDKQLSKTILRKQQMLWFSFHQPLQSLARHSDFHQA